MSGLNSAYQKWWISPDGVLAETPLTIGKYAAGEIFTTLNATAIGRTSVIPNKADNQRTTHIFVSMRMASPSKMRVAAVLLRLRNITARFISPLPGFIFLHD